MKRFLVWISIILMAFLLTGGIQAKDNKGDWTIYPGRGIGRINLGMPFKQVENNLGVKYKTKGFSATRLTKHYKDLGLLFFVDNGDQVAEILVLKVGYSSAIYETKHHIRIGSSKNDVVSDFGTPLKEGARPNYEGTGFTFYKGIIFHFDDNGKVDSIHITR
jgi:hypothetical protein